MADTIFQPIKSESGNLQGASYNASAQEVVVEFKNGSVYAYAPVSLEEWSDFQSTFQTDESSGRHFNNFIKPKAFTRLK